MHTFFILYKNHSGKKIEMYIFKKGIKQTFIINSFIWILKINISALISVVIAYYVYEINPTGYLIRFSPYLFGNWEDESSNYPRYGSFLFRVKYLNFEKFWVPHVFNLVYTRCQIVFFCIWPFFVILNRVFRRIFGWFSLKSLS